MTRPQGYALADAERIGTLHGHTPADLHAARLAVAAHAHDAADAALLLDVLGIAP